MWFWPSSVSEPKRRPCSKCGKNRAERFYTSPRGRVCTTCQRATRRTASRRARITTVYGLEPEDTETLLAEQDGKCAICGGARAYQLDVDHCHELERQGQPMRATVRGLLCRRCNRQLLPACRDNPELLEAAAVYLRKGPRWPMPSESTPSTE